MSQYVDYAPIAPEPITAEERADLKDEREAAEYADVYAQVQAERGAAGKSAAPIMVAAETMRRLRVKYAG
jgi:hypothetical protein